MWGHVRLQANFESSAVCVFIKPLRKEKDATQVHSFKQITSLNIEIYFFSTGYRYKTSESSLSYYVCIARCYEEVNAP